MKSGELKGGRGVRVRFIWLRKHESGVMYLFFKNEYRMSGTVCSGPVGLLCLNLGGWVSLGVVF